MLHTHWLRLTIPLALLVKAVSEHLLAGPCVPTLVLDALYLSLMITPSGPPAIIGDAITVRLVVRNQYEKSFQLMGHSIGGLDGQLGVAATIA